MEIYLFINRIFIIKYFYNIDFQYFGQQQGYNDEEYIIFFFKEFVVYYKDIDVNKLL